MPAAARVGDPTSHGSPLTPLAPVMGSQTVFIGKQPAWRAISDVHVCPLLSGTVPHVGGVVNKGSTSVFIDKLPAARQGDQITESGPPNTITTGFPTVLIGG